MNPYDIVNEIEGVYKQYIVYEIGKFYCLVCNDETRYEGSSIHAREHIKLFHTHIADQIRVESNEKIKKLFAFNKSARTFLCLFCNHEFRGSLFNAKDHVASKHKEIAFQLGFLEEQEARKQFKKTKFFSKK